MTLKLYGNYQSSNTFRVIAILRELDAPYEYIEVDWRKIKTPEVLEKQPFGLLPYIDDDGFVIYESRAICRYLATKYAREGKQLIPTELKANALFEQAMSIEQSNFDRHASEAVWEVLVKPNIGQTTDVAAFEKIIVSLSAKLDAYDVILGKQKYLAGDEVTLADLMHLTYGSLLGMTGSNIMESKPNVARWFKDISSREAWVALKPELKRWAPKEQS